MSSHCPPADGDADAAGDVEDVDEPLPTGRLKRSQAPRLSCKKSARQRAKEDGYIDIANSEPPGSSEKELMEEAPSTPPGDDGDNNEEPDTGPRTYGLRSHKRVNYAIPPPIEEMRPTKVPVNDETRARSAMDPGGMQRHRAVGIHGHAGSC